MIAGIILAAGTAKRMGCSKQLLPLGEKTIVWQVANTACLSKIDTVILVTGAYHEQVSAAVQDLDLSLVHNPNWAAGQASSLKAGLQALHPEVSAVMFLLADQPLVTPALINALLDQYARSGRSIICPAYNNHRGTPVLFDRKTWQKSLDNLQGDRGARQILAANPDCIDFVAVDSEDYFCDVDTESDYRKVCSLFADKAARFRTD